MNDPLKILENGMIEIQAGIITGFNLERMRAAIERLKKEKKEKALPLN